MTSIKNDRDRAQCIDGNYIRLHVEPLGNLPKGYRPSTHTEERIVALLKSGKSCFEIYHVLTNDIKNLIKTRVEDKKRYSSSSSSREITISTTNALSLLTIRKTGTTQKNKRKCTSITGIGSTRQGRGVSGARRQEPADNREEEEKKDGNNEHKKDSDDEYVGRNTRSRRRSH